ncbi:hypothetical protein ABTK05_21075, partial [Acinetobacter baumannii]
TLHFVQLGLGLAIVNSICKLPRSLVARKLPELPPVLYHLFHLRDRAKSKTVADLKDAILATARK